MRPFALLVAACLCAILLYDRASSPFPAGTLAAVVSGPTAQTLQHQETRLEKLQHYQVLMHLLAVERDDLKYRTENRNDVEKQLSEDTFEEQIDKELRPTWRRMRVLDFNWRDNLPADKKEAMIEEENKRKELIERQRDSYTKALQNRGSEAAKALAKKLDMLPVGKEFRAQQDFVNMLERERAEAREALKRN
jgi:hypothetical protein